MAYTQETITVAVTATAIVPTAGTNVGAESAVFRTGPVEVLYLGGSDVATTDGVVLTVDTVYEVDLTDGAPYLVAGVSTDVNVAFGSSRRG